jgi:hypothetical protein
MKKTFLLGIVILFNLTDCKEKEVPLVADFDAEITGTSPNATIVFTSSSTGADTYEWTFGEGANITTSSVISPSISVEKAGLLTVTLTIHRGAEENSITQDIDVFGNSAILEFTDVEFALGAGDLDYGRFFSVATGQVYIDTEVNANNGSTISLAFESLGQTLHYFQSPSSSDYSIPNATQTKVINFPAGALMSIAQFEAMDDDEILADLTINDDGNGFGNGNIPGIVLFQISDGRIGAIKTRSINADRLLVDIKVQKY